MFSRKNTLENGIQRKVKTEEGTTQAACELPELAVSQAELAFRIAH